MLNVRDHGAVGNGVADDAPAIQRLLDGGMKEIHIPAGEYRLAHTLAVDSFTTIDADRDARLFVCGETDHGPGDFLLTNRDWRFGNAEIELHGGVWDGNNMGRTNFKDPDLFNPNACTGTVLNFRNVRGLTLEDLVVANSVVYFVRMCMLDGFTIRNVGFQSDVIENNQDGLHFNGWVRDGIVENVRALTRGQTNDDLVALNADDCMTRLENVGAVCGPIENVVFRGLYAEDCHTAVRMLSFTSPIRNIRFERVRAGCRCFAINMDAARHCRTPLFKDADFPDGVGCIEHVTFDDMRVWWSTPGERSGLITCESRVADFTLTNFHRDLTRDRAPAVPTLHAAYAPGLPVRARRGDETVLNTVLAADPLTLTEPFTDLRLG